MYGIRSVETSCFPWTMEVSVMNLARRRIILKSIAEGSNVRTVVVSLIQCDVTKLSRPSEYRRHFSTRRTSS